MIDFSAEQNFESFKRGETVFKENSIGNVAYGVVTGEVELRVNGQFIATVRENEMFGEMALLDPDERSATATCIENTTLAVIDKDRFLSLIVSDPKFALSVMRTLAARLRVENRMR